MLTNDDSSNFGVESFGKRHRGIKLRFSCAHRLADALQSPQTFTRDHVAYQALAHNALSHVTVTRCFATGVYHVAGIGRYKGGWGRT